MHTKHAREPPRALQESSRTLSLDPPVPSRNHLAVLACFPCVEWSLDVFSFSSSRLWSWHAWNLKWGRWAKCQSTGYLCGIRPMQSALTSIISFLMIRVLNRIFMVHFSTHCVTTCTWSYTWLFTIWNLVSSGSCLRVPPPLSVHSIHIDIGITEDKSETNCEKHTSLDKNSGDNDDFRFYEAVGKHFTRILLCFITRKTTGMLSLALRVRGPLTCWV